MNNKKKKMALIGLALLAVGFIAYKKGIFGGGRSGTDEKAELPDLPVEPSIYSSGGGTYTAQSDNTGVVVSQKNEPVVYPSGNSTAWTGGANNNVSSGGGANVAVGGM